MCNLIDYESIRRIDLCIIFHCLQKDFFENSINRNFNLLPYTPGLKPLASQILPLWGNFKFYFGHV